MRLAVSRSVSLAWLLAIAAALLFGSVVSNAQAGTYWFGDCKYHGQYDPYPYNSFPIWSGQQQYIGVPNSAAFDATDRVCKGPGTNDPDRYSILRAKLHHTYSSGDIGTVRYKLDGNLGFLGLDYKILYAFNSGAFHSSVQLNDAGGANPVSVPNGEFKSFFLPTGQRRSIFRGYIRCNAATCKTTSSPSSNSIVLLDTRLVIEDTQAPIAAWAGTLSRSAVNSGVKTIQAIGIDSDSGIDKLQVIVNGTTISTIDNPSCDRTSHSKLVSCTTPFDSTVSANTATPPWRNGTNTVAVCASDFAEPIGFKPAYQKPANIKCDSANVTVSN